MIKVDIIDDIVLILKMFIRDSFGSLNGWWTNVKDVIFTWFVSPPSMDIAWITRSPSWHEDNIIVENN